ncbi:hypothetical protein PVAP13_4NG221755 [Panicum virgatum]|uniref:non-specific serine/threonine protein kinase n=1 Tax=Panicum virgatum TaxID=38727 RepID=A0A8T0TCR0_PANVG|nr:hypothetical protein PVAP13_4NG221755 [Panicum virgatum]
MAAPALSSFVFLLNLIHLILHISALDILSSGSSLSAERSSDVLRSPDGTFTCGLYNISPNASTFSIWFSKVPERTVVWSANPLHPVYSWGSTVKLNFDGSMVLRDYGGQIVWTNNVSSNINAEQAQLLDTGNLIVKGKGWFILRREGKHLRGAWPAEAGYEMITNHFRRYTYREIATATGKFKDELGRGASGIVYRGILKDNRAIAAKKLGDINQGGEEFQHELSVIGRIYHMNLVRVWGFCSDGQHRMLISEYVENGSLDKILFGVGGSEILLEWKQRFNIALAVARGLAYLHHECLEWVIHCDVKPENILLDKNFEAKIADFGLAKLLNRGGSNLNVSRIQGTRGYLAPEWVSSLPITAKVDVYSFGVVLLELLKGARISDMEKNEDEEVEMVLGRIVRMLKENLQLDGTEQSWVPEFIDARLKDEFNYLQARTMIKLAVSCLEEDRSRRPTMENVLQMLVSVDEVSSATVMGGAA